MSPPPSPNHPPSRWVIPAPKKNLVVGVGDMLVSNDTQALLVTYSLGSCVAVAIYDPFAKVGGLLHAMLPDSSINREHAISRPYMFVDTGLPAMFHAVYALGGMKPRLTIKLAGGAELLDERKIFNVGRLNVAKVLTLLERNQALLQAQDTGGHESRTVRLDLSNGVFSVDISGEKSRAI
jgi:chemotaxis protein CheD